MTLAVAIAALVWGSPILFFTFLVCRYWREERQLADADSATATARGAVPSPPVALRAVALSNHESRRDGSRGGS